MTLRDRWLWGSAALTATSGCPDPKPCNPLLHDGESFSVEILSKVDVERADRPAYSGENTPSCGDIDPIAIAARIDVALQQQEEHGPSGNVCYDYVCPVGFPTPAETSSARVGSYGGTTFVCYNGEATIQATSACALQRFVTLTHGDDVSNIYAEPDADGVSPVRLTRALVVLANGACSVPPAAFPDAAGQSGYLCYDQWNVQLRPSSAKE